MLVTELLLLAWLFRFFLWLLLISGLLFFSSLILFVFSLIPNLVIVVHFSTLNHFKIVLSSKLTVYRAETRCWLAELRLTPLWLGFAHLWHLTFAIELIHLAAVTLISVLLALADLTQLDNLNVTHIILFLVPLPGRFSRSFFSCLLLQSFTIFGFKSGLTFVDMICHRVLIKSPHQSKTQLQCSRLDEVSLASNDETTSGNVHTSRWCFTNLLRMDPVYLREHIVGPTRTVADLESGALLYR